jgi:hypothetical protein
MKKSLSLLVMFAVAVVVITLTGCEQNHHLTNQKAYGAISKFANGNAQLTVVGVRETSQQGTMVADIVVKDWFLERPKNDMVTAYVMGPGGGTFHWSGNGVAIFVHYTDGWVLKTVSIGPYTWNNLNIPAE